MWGPDARCSKHGNWSSCYMKGGDVYEKLSNCLCLKGVSCAWRYSPSAKAAAESFLLLSVTAAK